MSKKQITFIYNAESGPGNAILDFGHKMFSPETYNCNLCKITHSNFGKNSEFKKFIKDNNFEFKFLYKDEYEKSVKESPEDFPLIQIDIEGKTIKIESHSINKMKNFSDLADKIREVMK